MRVSVIAPTLALPVQVVLAAEIGEGCVRSVVNKRLPVIFAGQLRASSGRVFDDIVGVAGPAPFFKVPTCETVVGSRCRPQAWPSSTGTADR